MGCRVESKYFRKKIQYPTHQMLHAYQLDFRKRTACMVTNGSSRRIFVVLKGERIMATWNSRGLRGSALEELINFTNDTYLKKSSCADTEKYRHTDYADEN